ncbi:hypothetical protein ABPG72_009288, partial [Tetrahymena utriculariae]
NDIFEYNSKYSERPKQLDEKNLTQPKTSYQTNQELNQIKSDLAYQQKQQQQFNMCIFSETGFIQQQQSIKNIYQAQAAKSQQFKRNYIVPSELNHEKDIQKKTQNHNNFENQIIIQNLPNVGLTCAVNSAIQTLKQIYYFDQKIFDNSGFAEDFVQLFQVMEEKNIQKIYYLVEMLVVKSKQIQKHTFGGDAYMCLINFFYEIKKSLSDDQQEQFDNNFSRKYQDKLKCSQQFGYVGSKLDEAFSDYGDKGLFKQINNGDIICSECQSQLINSSIWQTKKIITNIQQLDSVIIIDITTLIQQNIMTNGLNLMIQMCQK